MTTQMLSPVADHRRDEWPDDLLERLAAGDSALWADVVRAFRPCLLARASEVGLKPWQRQDMEQRVWLALLRNATSIRNPACLPGWLSTTARRTALTVLRGPFAAVSDATLLALSEEGRGLLPISPAMFEGPRAHLAVSLLTPEPILAAGLDLSGDTLHLGASRIASGTADFWTYNLGLHGGVFVATCLLLIKKHWNLGLLPSFRRALPTDKATATQTHTP